MQSAAFAFHDLAPTEESFRDAVVAGLSREPKALPCKFFYDARGSALFEQICQVPEYYLTRTEIAILERICRRHRRADRSALPADRAWQRRQHQGAHPAARAGSAGCLCPDRHFPRAAARSRGAIGRATSRRFRSSRSAPITPARFRCRRFPVRPASGSGFSRDRRSAISSRTASCASCGIAPNCSEPDCEMLIGADLKKAPERLNAAYNDRAGMNAAFNLNLLVRINRELDGDIDVDRFAHVAFYNEAAGRMELYLKSLADADGHGRRPPFRICRRRTRSYRELVQIRDRRVRLARRPRRVRRRPYLDRPRRAVQRPLSAAAIGRRARQGRLQFRDDLGERRAPGAQLDAEGRSDARAVEDRVCRPPRRGRVVGGRDGLDARRRSAPAGRQIEYRLGETVPGHGAGAGEMVGSPGRIAVAVTRCAMRAIAPAMSAALVGEPVWSATTRSTGLSRQGAASS